MFCGISYFLLSVSGESFQKRDLKEVMFHLLLTCQIGRIKLNMELNTSNYLLTPWVIKITRCIYGIK